MVGLDLNPCSLSLEPVLLTIPLKTWRNACNIWHIGKIASSCYNCQAYCYHYFGLPDEKIYVSRLIYTKYTIAQ